MNCGCPCRYQRECVELSQWLQSALERLEFWNTQAVLVPQELETVRDHLSAFLVRTQIIYFSFIFFNLSSGDLVNIDIYVKSKVA